MKYDDIEQLAQLVTETGVAEITLRGDGRRITIRKAPPSRGALVPYVPNVPPAASTELSVPVSLPNSEQDATEHVISAPMVGFFRHAEPPIAPGVAIKQDQVVGVIEAMKLLNEIRTEIAGIVQEVNIEAGMAVEYGQPLFVLSPQSAGGTKS